MSLMTRAMRNNNAFDRNAANFKGVRNLALGYNLVMLCFAIDVACALLDPNPR
jgi:hypothetical protein